MRRSGREIAVMQVVRFHSRFDEGPHQVDERLRVIIDPLQKHALADQHRAFGREAPARGAGAFGQFARMVGVHRHDRRLAFGHESARQRLCHPVRRGDRQAGMPTQHFDVINPRERPGHLGEAAGRKGQRIAACQDDLPNPHIGAHVVESRCELG